MAPKDERRTPRDTGAEPTKQTYDEQCLLWSERLRRSRSAKPSKLLRTGLGPRSFLRIIRKLTLRRDFGHSRTRKRLSQIPRQELSELPLHYSSISIILKRSSAHLCARVHVPPCLALGQCPHPAQLLGADAARGFWRWWLQSRRSRCRRWWLR